jgi:DNA processing protein
MPQLGLEIWRNCAQNDLDDLRKTDALSYISRQGGQAPRNAGAAAAALLCAGGGPPRPRGVVMIDLVELVALSLLPLKCWRRAFDALRGGESPARILQRLAGDVPADNPYTLPRLRSDAAAGIARAARQAIAPVAWSEAAYPLALATIADPPPVLWTRGRVDALSAPAVAIVGSRAASQYALSIAEQLAHDLASRGLVIVSGLARGVDSAAHRGALAAGGVTVAVLGSGVDVMYPPEHAPLAAEIDERGAVISELVPGTSPAQFFFPLRNRIISGLSRAVVVIEAGEKSGSLITARCALEQGRDVLAVPGNVLSGRNRGAHGLLRDGAKIVESADDILEELGMAGPRPRAGTRHAAVSDPILACMTAGEPCDLDAIAAATGLGTAKLLPRLFELEVQGEVARVGGGRFVRVRQTC